MSFFLLFPERLWVFCRDVIVCAETLGSNNLSVSVERSRDGVSLGKTVPYGMFGAFSFTELFPIETCETAPCLLSLSS